MKKNNIIQYIEDNKMILVDEWKNNMESSSGIIKEKDIKLTTGYIYGLVDELIILVKLSLSLVPSSNNYRTPLVACSEYGIKCVSNGPVCLSIFHAGRKAFNWFFENFKYENNIINSDELAEVENYIIKAMDFLMNRDIDQCSKCTLNNFCILTDEKSENNNATNQKQLNTCNNIQSDMLVI